MGGLILLGAFLLLCAGVVVCGLLIDADETSVSGRVAAVINVLLLVGFVLSAVLVAVDFLVRSPVWVWLSVIAAAVYCFSYHHAHGAAWKRRSS